MCPYKNNKIVLGIKAKSWINICIFFLNCTFVKSLFILLIAESNPQRKSSTRMQGFSWNLNKMWASSGKMDVTLNSRTQKMSSKEQRFLTLDRHKQEKVLNRSIIQIFCYKYSSTWESSFDWINKFSIKYKQTTGKTFDDFLCCPEDNYKYTQIDVSIW